MTAIKGQFKMAAVTSQLNSNALKLDQADANRKLFYRNSSKI